MPEKNQSAHRISYTYTAIRQLIDMLLKLQQ